MILFNRQTYSQVLHLMVPAKAEYLSLVRVVVAAVAGNSGFGSDAVADIKVALSEASTNVIRHAYVGDVFSLEQRVMEINCFQHNGELLIEVMDRGCGMPLPPPPSEGLGLGIISSLMDDVDVETGDGGTTVTLVKNVATRGRS